MVIKSSLYLVEQFTYVDKSICSGNGGFHLGK